MTSRYSYERRLSEERRFESQRNDLARKVETDRVIRSNLSSDDRVENKRRQRETEEEWMQAQKITAMQQERINSETMRRKMEDEERMAKELKRRQEEKMREEKMLQRIRQESDEIRQLESKLQAAYVNKERSGQLEEKKLIDEQKKAIERVIDEDMERLRVNTVRREAEIQQARRDAAVTSKKQLEDQMQEREDAKRKLYEEFLRDKMLIDEIVQKIQMEDQAEATSRLHKQKETREFINQYLYDREKWKQEEARRIEEENKMILQHAEQQQQRDQSAKDRVRQQQAERDRVAEKLSEEVRRQKAEKERYEDIRTELAMEEAELKQRQRDREALEKKIRQQIELMQANEFFQQQRQERKRMEAAEEEKFRVMMMEKLAEEDRIEQMNAQKRRLRVEQHRRQVEDLIEQRRQMRLQQKEDEAEQLMREKEIQELRNKLIEQERQRLLREHAIKLLGHLPKGVFANDAEVDSMPEEIRSTIRHRPSSRASSAGFS
eukprot:TRINITY_DN4340_c0_g1_i1.p1 TRINITY_DN4340_c0_g1~~TRINITY_DN4340_c0_g1_i1.p1  ORF type:complete len:493 (-),score=146.93 TRINITY_DN4340_c0_g1_i1:487-1965(-)